MFLDCKVFNTSVDKFVENKAAVPGNFPQFNTLPRFALIVCNTDDSYSVETAAEANGRPPRVQNWNQDKKRKEV